MINIIIGLLVAYFGLTALTLNEMYRYNGNWYFNPIENYHDWSKLNFPTVIALTLLLNIIFAPYAVIYWLVIFLKFIATVGKK